MAYLLVAVGDAMSTTPVDAHAFSLTHIYRAISRVVAATDVRFVLEFDRVPRVSFRRKTE